MTAHPPATARADLTDPPPPSAGRKAGGWQPLRHMPVLAVVDVCDAFGHVAKAVRANAVDAPVLDSGRLFGPPALWRWPP